MTASERRAAGDAARWSFELAAGELYGLREARGWRVTASRSEALSLALEAARFGTELYEERAVGFVVGRAIDDGLSVSVGVRALGLSAAGTDDAWAGSVNAGLCAALLGRLGATARWENIGGAVIGGSPVASTMRLSGALFLEGLLLTTSVLIEGGFDPSPSLAVEFVPASGLSIRAGSGARPGRFTAGCGVFVRRGSSGGRGTSVDVAWEWHPELGVSSHASVSFTR